VDYKKFYELSFDLMCVVDRTHFLSVNDKFPRHLGYTREEMLARPWVEFIHPDDRAASVAASSAELKADTTFVNRYLTKDGRYIWLEWRYRPDENGEVYATCRDITERKVIEDQLGRYLIDLRRSNEELEQFAYAASHDLQEPLRTISNYAQFIQEDYGEKLPAELKEHLGYIVEAAKQGRALVNDLLELSRVGRNIQFGWVDLNDIVDQAVISTEFQIRETRATVKRESLPLVWGDPVTLLLLVRNLISNAVKFRKDTAPPEVFISGRSDAAAWHFSVKDNGIGMDPKYSQQVFAVFKRLDRSRPGTGIGLSICRKVVDLHGGRIWIDSAPGAGATVHITVPRPDHHAFHPSEHTTGRGSPSGRADGPAGLREAARSPDDSLGAGRGGGVAVLAAGGFLRDRPTPRSGSPRSEPPQGLGV
jgi:PAS domain S-box-containing protein